VHPVWTSPMSGPATLSDVERRIGSPLGRHCVLRFGSHCVCVLFTRPARPSTRIIKPSLHGRNHIGPNLSTPESRPRYRLNPAPQTHTPHTRSHYT
jgi:hypothetical protein